MNEIFDLENYKNYLISQFRYECDNNELCKNKRKEQLDKFYNDAFLQKIIDDTLSFIISTIENNLNSENRWCDIDLLESPGYIFLNLTGGWFSDTLYYLGSKEDKKIISRHLLKKFLGTSFYVDEDYNVEEVIDEDDELAIYAEYTYPFIRIVGDFSLLKGKYEELRNLKKNELVMILKRKLEMGICN